MAKKRKKARRTARPGSDVGSRQPSYWLIAAAVLFFFSAGVAAKLVFFPVSDADIELAGNQNAYSGDAALESRVKIVAANFRCACGGCGELFLVDCTCDMPRGAKEEKDFIRKKLRQGLTVDQVIDLVDKEYGHKIV